MKKISISLPQDIALQMIRFADQDRRSVSSAYTLAAELLLERMKENGRYSPITSEEEK